MTDLAAISGNYADFKLVKTRSVAAVIIEIPIERAEAFLSVFGVPQPGAERPVALALLSVPKQPEKPRQKWDSMKRSQQAGILCVDRKFQDYIGVNFADDAAEAVRSMCGVDSRSGLDGDPKAAAKWDALVSKYRQATGQMAEQRG